MVQRVDIVRMAAMFGQRCKSSTARWSAKYPIQGIFKVKTDR